MRRRNLARRTRAYVGLGANLGDAGGTIAAAIRELDAEPGLAIRGVSRLYATAPVGLVDQPEFRNAAVAVDVPSGSDPESGAVSLLRLLKTLEQRFGRRERQRWGPREIDLDLLLFGRARVNVDRPLDVRSDNPAKPGDLVVPHRLVGERLFVLAPLEDLAPGLVPPGWHETIADAAARRRSVEGRDAVRVVAVWDGFTWRPAAD